MKKVFALIISLFTLFGVSCSEDDVEDNKGKGKIAFTVNYDGDLIIKQLKVAVFDKDQNPPTTMPVATITYPDSKVDSGVSFPINVETTAILGDGNYWVVVYGDVDITDGMQPTSKDPQIYQGPIEIKNSNTATVEITLHDPTGPLACFEQSCSTNGDCNCDADFCVPESAAHAGITNTKTCTLTGCANATFECPEGTVCIELPEGHSFEGVTSLCGITEVQGSGSLKMNVEYSGMAIVKRLGIAIFKANQDGGMPYKVAYDPTPAEENGILFPYEAIVTDIEPGDYNVVVYGDIDTTDGYSANNGDPSTQMPVTFSITVNTETSSTIVLTDIVK